MDVPIDFDVLTFIWAVLVTLLSAATGFAWLWLTRHFVRKEDLDRALASLDSGMDRHNDRITVCEQTLKHVPDRSDLHGVRSDIAGLRSELAELRGEQASQNRLLSSIHDHLLNRS